MIICPNLGDPKIKQQFEELVDNVGENEAYFLWSKNGGHPLDKTPDGKESKLFKDLLELTDNDRDEAIKLKSRVYSPEFTAWFGDWHRVIRKGDNKKQEIKQGVPELFESNFSIFAEATSAKEVISKLLSNNIIEKKCD